MTRRREVKRFEVAELTVKVYPSARELAEAAAEFVADRLRRAIAEDGEARAMFATGASQLDFLRALRQMHSVDWSRVTAFHLDEYLALPADHPASFRRYLRERLFNQLPFAAVHLLAGDAADPQAECARYSALLREAPIDVACIGIGENAHLAFNDPPADFGTTDLVHVVNLDEACRRQQVGEGHFQTMADVPRKALSLTVPAILASETISCVVPDERKAEAVRCALEGPISPHCPASALRRHGDCQLFLDEAAASSLSESTRP